MHATGSLVSSKGHMAHDHCGLDVQQGHGSSSLAHPHHGPGARPGALSRFNSSMTAIPRLNSYQGSRSSLIQHPVLPSMSLSKASHSGIPLTTDVSLNTISSPMDGASDDDLLSPAHPGVGGVDGNTSAAAATAVEPGSASCKLFVVSNGPARAQSHARLNIVSASASEAPFLLSPGGFPALHKQTSGNDRSKRQTKSLNLIRAKGACPATVEAIIEDELVVLPELNQLGGANTATKLKPRFRTNFFSHCFGGGACGIIHG